MSTRPRPLVPLVYNGVNTIFYLNFKHSQVYYSVNFFCKKTIEVNCQLCYTSKTQSMSCEGACTHPHVQCACKIHSGKCAGCVCVRPFFGRAMCDRTFAHFWGQNCQKMLHFRTSFPALERPFLFWIILFFFGTH